MNHPSSRRSSLFIVTLLTCGLVCGGLVRVSFAANLGASSDSPRVDFDDTDNGAGAEWRIVGNESFFEITDGIGNTLFHQ